MTIDKLKAAVYDRMVVIEAYKAEIKLLSNEIQQLTKQINQTVKESELDKTGTESK